MNLYSEDETDDDEPPILFREFIRGCLSFAVMCASVGAALGVMVWAFLYAAKATIGAFE